MISVLLGLMIFSSPIPQPVPLPVPLPKPKPIVFQVGQSEHEKQMEADRLKYEQSWQHGTSTAYYNGKDVMNGETGITASGYDLDNGAYYRGYRILASTRSIPLGTLIDIKLGKGEILHCVVLDRGGNIKGSHFDLVLESKTDCLQFGVQDIEWQKVGKINC